MSFPASFFRRFARWMTSSTRDDVPMERKRSLANRGRWLLRPPVGTRRYSEPVGERPGHWLVPPHEEDGRTILYLHGGGWVYGWAPFYDMFVGQIARAASARTYAVDYRLAPEFPFPAALEDCLAAYRQLLDAGVDPKRLVVMGDSAGGNLTLTMLLSARDAGLPMPAAAVCMSPATDLRSHGHSFEDNVENDVVLSVEFAAYAGQAYLAGHDPCDPLVSPVCADLHDFPPLLIQVGEHELLLCDAQDLAEKAARDGVPVTLSVYPEMWHVWQTFSPWLPEARRAIAEIGAFTRRMTEELD